MTGSDFTQIPSDDSPIQFFSEDINFEYPDPDPARQWIQSIAEQENGELDALNFIFCSDEYLHRLNVEYLQHDTLTDIITFPYAELPLISGDLFISIDRVRDNARVFKTSFETELHRVMIHGVLHLCGLGDKTEKEIALMRAKEDAALSLLEKMSHP